MPARVILVRHGETALNESPERVRGHADPPLSREGLKEATRIATRVSRECPAVIYTSDMQRATRTAEAIEKKCGIEEMSLAGLRPWDLGHLTGKRKAEVRSQILEYVHDPKKLVPGGETYAAFLTRFYHTLRDILDAAEKHHTTVIVVTHSSGMRAVMALFHKGDGAADPVKPGHDMILEQVKTKWVLHLDKEPAR